MEFLSHDEQLEYRRNFRKGKIEGRIEAKQELLVRLLAVRFWAVPLWVEVAIESLDDPVTLDELFPLALRCRLKTFESKVWDACEAAGVI
ncbi:MAG: hypothetical protein ACREEM_47855 [Blastocatellia bacterium]